MGSSDSYKRIRGGSTPQTTSKVLRTLFLRLDRSTMTTYELAAATDTLPASLSLYRHGRQTPSILKVEELADALGYELKLVKKEETDNV